MIVCNKCKSAISLEEVNCVEVLNRLKIPCPVCFAEGELGFTENPPGEIEWEQRLNLQGYQWMIRTDRFFDYEDDMALSRVLVLVCRKLNEKGAGGKGKNWSNKMEALLRKLESLRLLDSEMAGERYRKKKELVI